MGLFRGRTTVTRANKISDFTIATAEYGRAVMEVLGTTRISGNVIYYDDFTAHEHREEQRTGKGGKSKSVNITYSYTVAAILGLCEGPVSGIRRIWKDKDIFRKSISEREGCPTYMFYDGPPTANGKPHIGHVLTRVIKDMIG